MSRGRASRSSRWRRLAAPEALEPRAAPGSGFFEVLLGVPVFMAFGGGEQPMLDAGEARWGPLEGPEAGHGRLVIRWAPDQDPWETLHGLNIVVAPSSGDETAVESTVPSVAIGAWLAVQSAGDLEAEPAGWLLESFEPWSGEESLDAGPHVLPWEELAAALAAGGMWWIGQAPAAGQGAEHAAPEAHGPKGEPGDQGQVDPGQPGGELPVEGDPGGGMATMSYGGGYGGGGYGGGGYGGGGYGGNQPPVAVADVAYSGKIGQPVTIYVLQNDSDPDGPRPTVTTVTQPAHGTAQVALGGGAVTYTAPPSAFQSDSFQYTVADSYGASASATVSVTLVEAEGYTVKWLDPEDTWVALSESDWSDAEDQLQWTAELPPTGLPTVSRIDFVKKPWDERDDPALLWQAFATNEQGTGPAVGGPGVGEWAVMPQVQFYSDVLPSQSSFCAMAAAPGKKGVVTIQEVRWEQHTDPPGSPQQGGELVLGSRIAFFPDAQSPTETLRPKVDVYVSVSPAKAGPSVDVRWFDVDDPTSSVAPIDDDPPANQQHPEVIKENNKDNRETWPNTDEVTLPATVAIGNDGIGRGVFEIGWLQPGNNYRIAATVHRSSGPGPKYLDYVKPLARDQQSRLFYDMNKNGEFNPGFPGEAIIEGAFKTVHVTPVLTVWRKLHVEVDSMGEVVGNRTYNSSGTVTNNHDGTSTVELASWLLGEDENRFENGQLGEWPGNTFRIASNSVSEVIVYNLRDGTIPVAGLPITLEDDDFLDFSEGDDVPMPDTGSLATAMARAFVQTLYDVGDHDTNVPFILNVNSDPDSLVAAQRWNSAADCSENYWTAYVLGAFQPKASEDGDPDSGDWTYGRVPSDNRGGALIFIETTWDGARSDELDPTVEEQDTVVHEVGHLFLSMEEPVTLCDDGSPSVYTDFYLAQIRSVPHPARR